MILSLVTCAALLAQDSRQPESPLDLSARFSQESVRRTTERGPNDGLVVYGIADLTGQHRLDALARDITSGDLSEETRIAALERYVQLLEGGEVAARAEDIRSTIEELIQPPLVGGSQRVALVDGSTLTVVGAPAQQAWVRDFLVASRTFDGLIDIQARVITAPEGALADLVDGRTGKVLNDNEVAVILRAVEKLEDVEEISAPRLVVFPSSRANLSVLNQTAYIKDYEIQVLPEQDQEIVDPVIDVLQTGLSLDVRGVPLAEGRLALRCKLDYATAERPFPEHKLRLGASGAEVTVQLPEVRKVQAKARFDIEPGGTIVMSSVDPGSDGKGDPRAIIVLLKAELVAAEAIEESAGKGR